MVPIDCNNKKLNKKILTTIIVFILFCGISLVSRWFLPLFIVVLSFGIAFPVLWARKTGNLTLIGFEQKNRKQALFWGLITGLLVSVYCIFSYIMEGGGAFPPMLELQLAFGIPIWLLIMSPFQEFFFRGWMQPRIQEFSGKWIGLGITSFCFAIWHIFPPFEETKTSTIPILTGSSIIIIFVFGLMWGYAFQRTKNILAPWMAHAIVGITMVVLGKMTFITFST